MKTTWGGVDLLVNNAAYVAPMHKVVLSFISYYAVAPIKANINNTMPHNVLLYYTVGYS